MSEETETRTTRALELSTEIDEPIKFAVDEEEYELFGLNHLGPQDEARAMALFARHENVSRALGSAPSERQAEKAATILRELRVKIFTVLTNMPAEKAAKIPLGGQVQLIDLIRDQMQPSDKTGDDLLV